MGQPLSPIDVARQAADRLLQQPPDAMGIAQRVVAEGRLPALPMPEQEPVTAAESMIYNFLNTMGFGFPEAMGLLEIREAETIGAMAGGAVGSLAGFIKGPIALTAKLGLAKPLKWLYSRPLKIPKVSKALENLGPEYTFRLNRIVESTSLLGTASVLAEAGPITMQDAPILDPLISGSMIGLAFGSAGGIKSIYKRIPVMSAITSVPTYLQTGDLEESLVQAGLGVYFGLRGGIPKAVERAQAVHRLAEKFMGAEPPMERAEALRTAELMEESLYRYFEAKAEGELRKGEKIEGPDWLEIQQDAFFKSLESWRQEESESAIMRSIRANELPAPEQDFLAFREGEQRAPSAVAPGARPGPVDPREDIVRRIRMFDEALPKVEGVTNRRELLESRAESVREFETLDERMRQEEVAAVMEEIDTRRFEMLGKPRMSMYEHLLAEELLTKEIIVMPDEPSTRFASELLARLGYSEAGGSIKDDFQLQLKLGQLSGSGREPRAIQLPDGTYRVFAKEAPKLPEEIRLEEREAHPELERMLEAGEITDIEYASLSRPKTDKDVERLFKIIEAEDKLKKERVKGVAPAEEAKPGEEAPTIPEEEIGAPKPTEEVKPAEAEAEEVAVKLPSYREVPDEGGLKHTETGRERFGVTPEADRRGESFAEAGGREEAASVAGAPERPGAPRPGEPGRRAPLTLYDFVQEPANARMLHQERLTPAPEVNSSKEVHDWGQYFSFNLGLDWANVRLKDVPEQSVLAVGFGKHPHYKDITKWPDPLPENLPSVLRNWIVSSQKEALKEIRERAKEEGFSELVYNSESSWKELLKKIEEGNFKDAEMMVAPKILTSGDINRAFFYRLPEGKPEVKAKAKVATEVEAFPEKPDMKFVGQEHGKLKKFGEKPREPLPDMYEAGLTEASAVVDQHGRLWISAPSYLPGLNWKPYQPGSWLNGPFAGQFGEFRAFAESELGKIRLINKPEYNATRKELERADKIAEKELIASFEDADRPGDMHPKRSKVIDALGKAVKRFASTDETRPVLQNAYFEGDLVVATNGHILLQVKGMNLLPKGLKSAFVKAAGMKNKDYRIYQATNEEGPYPNWRQVMPDPAKVPEWYKVPVEDFLRAVETSGVEMKAGDHNMVYLMLYDLTPFGSPGKKSLLIKRSEAVGKEDLHNAIFQPFNALFMRDLLRTAKDFGLESVELGMNEVEVGAALMRGKVTGGPSLEMLIMPLRGTADEAIRKSTGKERPQLERIMSLIGRAQIRLADAKDKAATVRAETQLEKLYQRARDMGISGIPAVESSLGAARMASIQQNRMARRLQTILEMPEAEYVQLKKDLMGKEHMLPKGKPGEPKYDPGMYAEEASRLINALSAKITAKTINEAALEFGELEPADWKDMKDEEIQDILNWYGKDPDTYPDIRDARGVGLFSLFRPVRHVTQTLEKAVKGAYTILFKPPHNASLGAFKATHDELTALFKNVDLKIIRSRASAEKVNRMLEIGAEEKDPTFQNDLMKANEARIKEIALEHNMTEGEVAAAKYVRQRYDELRTIYGAMGLDIGYVFGYSPHLASAMDFQAMNIAIPGRVPEKIEAFMEKERTGELEHRKDDAFELFMTYVRKGYRTAYLRGPISSARDFLLMLKQHGRRADIMYRRQTRTGQAELLDGEVVFTGEDPLPDAVVFAARQNRHFNAIAKYYETYYSRLMGYPSKLDHRLAESIRGFARGTGIAVVLDKLGVDIEKDAFVMKMTDTMIRLGYMGGLGFRPISAMKNLTQSNNTIADIGPMWWLKGMARAMREQTMPDGETMSSYKYLREMGVLREFAPEYYREISLRKTTMKSAADVSLAMFQWADAINRMGAYFGANEKFNYFLKQYRDGSITEDQFYKSSGVAGEHEPVQKEIRALIRRNMESMDFMAAHRFSEEVTGRTQYLYNKEDSPLIGHSAGGRMIFQYQTWPENYVEMGYHWAQNKQYQKFGRWCLSSFVMVALLKELARLGLEGLKPENVMFAGPLPTRRTEYGQISPPIAPVPQLAMDIMGGPFALVKDLQAGKDDALRTFVRTLSRDFDIFIPGHSAFRDISPLFYGERTSVSREITGALFPPEPKKKKTRPRGGRSRSR